MPSPAPLPLVLSALLMLLLQGTAQARPALAAAPQPLEAGLKPIIPSTGLVAVSGALRVVDDGEEPMPEERTSMARVPFSDSMRLAQSILRERIRKERQNQFARTLAFF